MRIETIGFGQSMVISMGVIKNCHVNIKMVANCPMKIEMTTALGHERMEHLGILESEFEMICKTDSVLDERIQLDPGSYYFMVNNDISESGTVAFQIVFEYDVEEDVKRNGLLKRILNRIMRRNQDV